MTLTFQIWTPKINEIFQQTMTIKPNLGIIHLQQQMKFYEEQLKEK